MTSDKSFAWVEAVAVPPSIVTSAQRVVLRLESHRDGILDRIDDYCDDPLSPIGTAF